MLDEAGVGCAVGQQPFGGHRIAILVEPIEVQGAFVRGGAVGGDPAHQHRVAPHHGPEEAVVVSSRLVVEELPFAGHVTLSIGSSLEHMDLSKGVLAEVDAAYQEPTVAKLRHAIGRSVAAGLYAVKVHNEGVLSGEHQAPRQNDHYAERGAFHRAILNFTSAMRMPSTLRLPK